MAVRLHRGVAVLLGMLATFPAAACSAGGSETSAKPKVAFVVASTQLNFSQEMEAGFRSAVQDIGGVDVQVTGPDIVDGPGQVRMFKSAARNAPAGVSVFTMSPDVFIGPLSEAAQQDLRMIAVDNPPPAERRDLAVRGQRQS